MRWVGFRRVRRQVCRRVRDRAADLGVPDLGAYRAYLEQHDDEWERLDALTSVTISRFYRDRAVFDLLEHEVLPALGVAAREARRATLAVWSAGCASGEEPYTLSIMWRLVLAPRFPELTLRILATDVEPTMLARAHQACYAPGSVRDLPENWRRRAFTPRGDLLWLRPRFREGVDIVRHDVRTNLPGGPYDLILCRNLAFTYFDKPLQRDVVGRFAEAMRAGAALVVGSHEKIPDEDAAFTAWSQSFAVYRRARSARR
jgi:chemotaxis protein methyltransferase CheR